MSGFVDGNNDKGNLPEAADACAMSGKREVLPGAQADSCAILGEKRDIEHKRMLVPVRFFTIGAKLCH
ncbi:hypothetical protein MNBD_BACTEROID07-770 [hydrothermal vent metagenome]|uniref:Uncharacterized protein n=1 Tax=hydrothermal vent metagenome TaxID=652676 RepID=A0A3B0UHV1_9ZZZZ